MFEKVSMCPICEGTEFTNVIICQDTLVSKESFVLADCKNCGLRITNPRPDQQSLPHYYKSEKYLPHSHSAFNVVSQLYHLARSYNIKWKSRILSSLQPKGALLDFGSGTGEFLSYMKKHGWKTYGVEPEQNSREFSIQKYKLNVVENLSYLADNQVFTAISLWHVLEHVPHINTQIEQLAAKLSKNGLFYIAVPNYESFDATFYKEHWAGYDVPRHLYHFSPRTMKKFLKKNKLSLETIIPMKLDAFYVSILSEKNMRNRGGLVQGLLRGYKSNQDARQKNNNYSSLLYIARK